MMNNKIKLFPLLMMMPLLMGNSPARQPSTAEYTDVDIYVNYVGVDKSKTTEDNVKYDIKVKNVGSKYIIPSQQPVRFYNPESYDTYYLDFEPTNQVFAYQAIAPGQEGNYITYTNQYFNFAQRYDVSFDVYQYLVEEADFTGASIKKDFKNNNTYILKVDNSKVPDLNLALLIDVEYKGDDLSFYMNFDNRSRTFTTLEELDLNQLKIKNITAYRETMGSSSYRTSTNFILMMILIIFFAITLTAILVPTLITAARRNKSKR